MRALILSVPVVAIVGAMTIPKWIANPLGGHAPDREVLAVQTQTGRVFKVFVSSPRPDGKRCVEVRATRRRKTEGGQRWCIRPQTSPAMRFQAICSKRHREVFLAGDVPAGVTHLEVSAPRAREIQSHVFSVDSESSADRRLFLVVLEGSLLPRTVTLVSDDGSSPVTRELREQELCPDGAKGGSAMGQIVG